MPKNEFSKTDPDLRKNPTEAVIVLYGFCLGSADLWRVDCRYVDLKFPFLYSCYVSILAFRDSESFSLLLGWQHPLSEISTYFL